jgi:hypothetical protein
MKVKMFHAGLGGLVLILSLVSLSFAQSVQTPLPPLLPAGGGQPNAVVDRRTEFLAKKVTIPKKCIFTSPLIQKGKPREGNRQDISSFRKTVKGVPGGWSSHPSLFWVG